MVKVRACIVRLSDGAVRVAEEDWQGGEWATPDLAVFQWKENNSSCDCNRHLSFERADPLYDLSWEERLMDEEAECGFEKLYQVPWIECDGVRYEIGSGE